MWDTSYPARERRADNSKDNEGHPSFKIDQIHGEWDKSEGLQTALTRMTAKVTRTNAKRSQAMPAVLFSLRKGAGMTMASTNTPAATRAPLNPCESKRTHRYGIAPLPVQCPWTFTSPTSPRSTSIPTAPDHWMNTSTCGGGF